MIRGRVDFRVKELNQLGLAFGLLIRKAFVLESLDGYFHF